MTSDAEPLAVLFHPGIREASLMLIGFPLERTFLVGGADYDDSIAVAVKFHVIRCFHGELVGFVANGFQELGLGHDRSVVVGEDKIIIQHFSHGFRVMMELHLVPEIFERKIFVSSPCALEILCAKVRQEKTSKRGRTRRMASAPSANFETRISVVFPLKMPR